jgi:sugar phosphate isomerase/epimerase
MRIPPVYIATVLLERNRWTPQKTPTLRVSDWAARFAEAGFDGIELWENHAALASNEEQALLERLPCPVAVFNSYAGLEEAGADVRHRAAAFAGRYGAQAIKYNTGNDPTRRRIYMESLRSWEEELSAGCRLLCECHPNTILETPPEAERFLKEAALTRGGIAMHVREDAEATMPEWIKRFGDDVRHVHLTVDGADRRTASRRRILALKRAGFHGSISIEFTEGVAKPGENPEALFASARDDLWLVREVWAE